MFNWINFYSELGKEGSHLRIQPSSRKKQDLGGGHRGDEAHDAVGLLLLGQGQEVQVVQGGQGQGRQEQDQGGREPLEVNPCRQSWESCWGEGEETKRAKGEN